jgi:hypothetical protein
MNSPENVSSILSSYNDKERLETILRLHKEGHVSMDEALNLLTGDRNFFLTSTIEQIQKSLEQVYRPSYPYTTTGGYVIGSTTGTLYNGTITGGSIYTNSPSN